MPEQAEISKKNSFPGVSGIYDIVPAIRPVLLGIHLSIGLLIKQPCLNIEPSPFSTESSSSATSIKEITAAKILQPRQCGGGYL
jgi:hypothetical protein